MKRFSDDHRPAVTVRLPLSPEILTTGSYVAVRAALRVVREEALATAAAAEHALRELRRRSDARGITARRRPLEAPDEDRDADGA